MTKPIQFPGEVRSNSIRATIASGEPKGLRTYTPTQAVLARSAGVFHWTPEGRRLYDYSSGVLVANLGHNPRSWLERLVRYLGWDAAGLAADPPLPPLSQGGNDEGNVARRTVDEIEYISAVPLTAYNAITELEMRAVERLLASVQASPGGRRLDSVMWAASGSEAIQKALWACLHFRRDRDVMLATRHGFHGKKGLAGAVTGSEKDPDRDPRVRFIGFPTAEIDDMEKCSRDIDLAPYRRELVRLADEHRGRINCLITEPYLGGGGSYHPPHAYLQMLAEFCDEREILFILDEVQSNFGRTGDMYAFETYGVEPDIVCLGKGLGNGVPVSAAVGRGDVFDSLKYGEASDTWSASPISCAAVLATLDEFEHTNVLEHARQLSEVFIERLPRLKETGVVTKVRGEGMVFGIECAALGTHSANEVANAVVEAAYLGRDGEGVHLLGPLAGNVIRVSPPLTMTENQAHHSLDLLQAILADLHAELEPAPTGEPAAARA
ncbi:MAG: aspartate aminotransferase family protein [Planctomycetes bacterium]|nr:aspartate aminotransferase family protein [Planctomycetota bacterium]